MKNIIAYGKLLSSDASSAAETSELNTDQIERLARASLIHLEINIANSLRRKRKHRPILSYLS